MIFYYLLADSLTSYGYICLKYIEDVALLKSHSHNISSEIFKYLIYFIQTFSGQYWTYKNDAVEKSNIFNKHNQEFVKPY